MLFLNIFVKLETFKLAQRKTVINSGVNGRVAMAKIMTVVMVVLMEEILSGEKKDSGNGGVNGRDTMAKRKTVVMAVLMGEIQWIKE